jgi:hypothetical protein
MASLIEPTDAYYPHINICYCLRLVAKQVREMRVSHLKEKIEPFRKQNNEALKKNDPAINERIRNDMELLTEYWHFLVRNEGLIKYWTPLNS